MKRQIHAALAVLILIAATGAAPARADKYDDQYDYALSLIKKGNDYIDEATQYAERGDSYNMCQALISASSAFDSSADALKDLSDDLFTQPSETKNRFGDLYAEAMTPENMRDQTDSMYSQYCAGGGGGRSSDGDYDD